MVDDCNQVLEYAGYKIGLGSFKSRFYLAEYMLAAGEGGAVTVEGAGSFVYT
jgi:hypothetical protein